jgi:hypothetical protein
MMTHSMNDRPCVECGDLDGCHMPAKIRDNRLSLAEFWDAQAEWSQATFGTDRERGPIGALKHLVKEATECQSKPGDLFEYADCLFLVFDSCRLAGFTFEQLRVACNEKLKINKARTWPRSVDGQPCEHVRA